MGSEFESYTAWLVEEVQAFAEMRAREAESYPEDVNLSQSSMSLRTLANNLGKLPPDHPNVEQLWRLWFDHLAKVRSLDLIRLVFDELKQYGYDRLDEGNPELFLNALHFELELFLDKAIAEPA